DKIVSSGGFFYFDVGTAVLPNDTILVRNISITNTALQINDFASTPPAPGTTYTIINNTGSSPIGGIFTGLPQSSFITNAFRTFQLSYTGGDGNDVVLTQVGYGAPAPTLGQFQSFGNGTFRINATGLQGYAY